MDFIDFFAGIGGFRRGMEMAGHKCIGFCEFDKFAAASYISMHLITEEQRAHLATLDLKKRQKEILKDEYLNGEWYSNDIRNVDARSLPKADCWCFGAPCQDFSVAGKRAGLDGDRSSLIKEIFRILREIIQEGGQDQPEWLIYENVKGMLSSNAGRDYLEILMEMDELGYDTEWFVFNSKYHGVPQNRERVYTIGHLRTCGPAKIFPLEGTDGENCVPVKLIGHRDGYRRNTQIFSLDGITEALDTASGGGRGHHVAIPVNVSRAGIGGGYDRSSYFNGEGLQRNRQSGNDGRFGIDKSIGGIVRRCIANTITAREDRGVSKHKQTGTAVAVCLKPVQPEVVLPCLTPDRAEKRQNGRRFKENGDESFTLTAQDRHGVAFGLDIESSKDHPGMYVELEDGSVVYAVWYEKYACYIAIRKLTPRECFKLQGWDDEYFDRAEFVNSDSQLYKQAGNGVTVNVVYEIAKRIAEIKEV